MVKIARLKDIAEAAGVSITTVSRILNHTATEVGISERTQERVWAIARELNYQPNREARNLRLGRRPRSILFLSLYEGRTFGEEGFLSHPFFGELMHAIQAEVSKCGCYLSYLAVNQDNVNSIATLLRDGVSGVITWGFIPPKLVKMLRRSGLPVAAIESYNNDLEGIHEVYVDNRQAVQLALDHLYESGYRRIVMANLSFQNGGMHPVFAERVACFQQYNERYADWEVTIEEYERCDGTSDISAGEILGKRIFEHTDSPVGILAVNDLTAIGILNAAQKSGVQIPSQIGVVGIDDIEWGRFHAPALTTIRIPKAQLAAEAVKYLAGQLVGERIESDVVLVDVELLKRETTPH